MKPALTALLAAAALAAAPASAQRAQQARCSFDDAPAKPCRIAFATKAGVRRLQFQMGNRRAEFVGRNQGGWWSGRLDGKPAMGFERNRGHVVFSTTNLSRTLSWYYPANEHGTY